MLGRSDLVRALARGGISSVAVAPPGDAIRHSRFVVRTIDSDSPSLVEELLEYAREAEEPPPLFYDSDRSLRFLSHNRERLGGGYRFVLPAPELVDDLMDKRRFQALAERLELPVPRARHLGASLPPGDDALGLAFPVVVKATPYRDGRWERIGLSSKVLRVDSPGPLRELLARIDGTGLEVVAQELVPGAEHRIESYHVYVDAHGEIAGEFTGRKIRTSPREFGMSTALVTTAEADVAALGREVVRRLDFRGVAKLDFKRAPDGRLHLLEVNPRFTLWTNAGAVAGVNLPALVYADLTGRPRPAAGPARAGVRWIWPSADAAAARRDGMSFAAWLRWAVRSETNASFSLSDPAPYLVSRVRWTLGRGPR